MTVSTSSTTLPIVLEAAGAPASIVEHRMVGERAGTAGKGQSRQPAARPCSLGWQVGAQGFEPSACAPCRSSAMPTTTRPAILSLRATCRVVRESYTGLERGARSADAWQTCNDDEAWEFVLADAPPALASSVHFVGAAPLRDSSARWGRGAPRPQTPTFSWFSLGWGSATGCPPLSAASRRSEIALLLDAQRAVGVPRELPVTPSRTDASRTRRLGVSWEA